MQLPKASSKLLITLLGDEMLVFDAGTDRAHCLSRYGKLVLMGCREKISRDALLAQLTEAGASNAEDALQEALNQLGAEGLIEQSGPGPFDRRRFLQAAGALAAAPVVASVLAPRPAQAASCSLCPSPGGVPSDCATCGGFCKNLAIQTCGGIKICNFEYVIVDDGQPYDPTQPTKHLIFPLGTVCTGGFDIEGQAAGGYACRDVSQNAYSFKNTYAFDCKTARELAINGAVAAGTNPANERYYCCNCAGTPAGTTYSCP